MKFVCIVVALLVLGGLVYFFQASEPVEKVEETTSIPEGFHKMPDGTLMPNEAAMEASNVASTSTSTTSVSSQSTITLDPTARVFTISGVNYGYDVKEIRVKEGDTVTINFESTDGFHDVVINEFAVATKRVQPGTKTSATFVADKKGTFEYYCSVGQHRANGQVGKLIVE